jgi:bacterioferritin
MLDGLPNLQALHKLLIGESTQEMLECDLKLERGAQQCVKDGIAACEGGPRLRVARPAAGDPRRHRGAHRVAGTQLDLIVKVGIQNYLQSQMGDVSEM